MKTMPKPMKVRTVSEPDDYSITLAHHDAAIQHLGGRMTGLETGLRTLQGEVHAGFTSIQTSMAQQMASVVSKLDKLDAAPKVNFHETIGTIVSLAGLFAIVCGGIIYITNSQSSALNAEQKILNETVTKQVEDLSGRVRELEAWRPVVTRKN